MSTDSTEALEACTRSDGEPTSGCPVCGDPLKAITTNGPSEHYAVPCKCKISPVQVRALEEGGQ